MPVYSNSAINCKRNATELSIDVPTSTHRSGADLDSGKDSREVYRQIHPGEVQRGSGYAVPTRSMMTLCKLNYNNSL